jgi:hexosaminidase
VARNFQTKETVLRLLDLLAFYKVNQLLFCITDDEGWRVEIDGLPELTDVGGTRSHQKGKESPALHPAYGSGSGNKDNFGKGYYSKADFTEILRYAAARHIKVIPEVASGPCRAAIKSMEARFEKRTVNNKRLKKAG